VARFKAYQLELSNESRTAEPAFAPIRVEDRLSRLVIQSENRIVDPGPRPTPEAGAFSTAVGVAHPGSPLSALETACLAR
jgi:hypothetical protein